MTDGELHYLLTQILNREARLQFLVKERSKNLNELSDLKSKSYLSAEAVDELRASRESWKKKFEDSQEEVLKLSALMQGSKEKNDE